MAVGERFSHARDILCCSGQQFRDQEQQGFQFKGFLQRSEMLVATDFLRHIRAHQQDRDMLIFLLAFQPICELQTVYPLHLHTTIGSGEKTWRRCAAQASFFPHEKWPASLRRSRVSRQA
ncbi:hypothetical protein Krac_4007 [Ktedonobacter racemifer DSM 44963]|uniref:Uncharacterized protein n=1 Tax=Ktedonobacter racemifer DSM 44963 TaxID=485913 RepID=D6TXP2_KTERA|nr:hypothetical protein Krac_4007 [Ktedonobacter racemifer DSM 44963]